MNKAITDGLVLSPPAFGADLGIWSRQDGRPGSDSYASAGTAVYVPADQDFGGCLEMLKTEATQPLRWMGETPILPGCYLRVTVRVKAMSGNLPTVRVAATPVAPNGTVAPGLATQGAAVALSAYGRVETVTAIIGTGNRGGVDLQWSDAVSHAHVGLDLGGATGGIVRIEDIAVEDVTGAFLRDMMDWVDVRDFGARGDGVADDTAAFLAADAAADGRSVLVSKGHYRLTDHVTFTAPVRFEGTVEMPVAKRLSLTENFELSTYIVAFGNEEEGFKKAIQALFNFTDHDTLDMNGRRVELTAPLDVQAAVYDKTTYANQRKIRNGQIQIVDGPAFDTEIVTQSCNFDASDPVRLTGVTNVASIPVGSLVEGPVGVGREVYVSGRNIAGQTLLLSQPLWGAPGQQTYTFSRFKYALDFSGFANLQRFTLQDIELLLADKASGILLPSNGLIFHVKDCFFTGPRDRGLTSHATGCQGMLIDRCQFLSTEGTADVQDRHTIGFNVNKNDTKIRNNRAVKFRHFAVVSGSGHIITGNHFFQGDTNTLGQRTAGMVLAEAQSKSVFMSNYVDNCYIEWTNEHDGDPAFQSELSFGGLQIVGNIIFSSNVPSSFAPIHIKPHGPGHFLNGVTITGNNFKTIKGQALERVDYVDDTHAPLDVTRFVDVNVHSNTFQAVSKQFQNPITLPVVENTAQETWEADLGDYLPFGGQARVVTAVAAEGRIKTASNATLWTMPYAFAGFGTAGQAVRLTWSEAAKGKVFVTARCDAPT
ncbi:glycosyl hydrolase family 28-related protein [Jannaschia ovalis]|uniref:Glycosyl hydrolase family 28-related protein n=1 Tax=Jannaschia ovalis TaxID=3038773 RepID=A0ABY8LFX8_9RHOB|nr:glycosyl hydrolase family 28-related protein [Jannaschia sp. GRR-S6-38]WGH80041.1 glycosyl hydrolase family 28-related protein [Jannaschia sp. GRR-S6-38]